MNKKMALMTLIFGVLLIGLSSVVFAQQDSQDTELLGPTLESGLEIVNAVLALVVVIIGFRLAPKLGQIGEAWKFVAIGILFFFLLELNNALASFNIFHIGGMSEILEFITIVLLLYGFYKLYKISK